MSLDLCSIRPAGMSLLMPSLTAGTPFESKFSCRRSAVAESARSFRRDCDRVILLGDAPSSGSMLSMLSVNRTPSPLLIFLLPSRFSSVEGL